jgi:hypothetical protein
MESMTGNGSRCGENNPILSDNFYPPTMDATLDYAHDKATCELFMKNFQDIDGDRYYHKQLVREIWCNSSTSPLTFQLSN